LTAGKIAWQTNPRVRRTLKLVQRLKDIAHAYKTAKDRKSRESAQRAWDKAMDDLRLSGAGKRQPPARGIKSKTAA
jgi:hypothetical protein